jgi:DNA-binding beta-propeller fold protein YncE
MIRHIRILIAGATMLSGITAGFATERRLYVTEKTGISVYDIDKGHKFVRKIDIPDSGDYKGIAASIPFGKLYVTSYKKDELICVDLKTDAVLWRRNDLGKYADSMMLTPDGKTMYLPFRDEIFWRVLNAEDGSILATINTERGKQYAVDPIANIGPHNTWINPNARRVYMEVLTVPYIYIADRATNKVIGKVGPFSSGIRPFAVTKDDKYIFANVDRLLGFEVAQAEPGGKVLYRVEAHTPAERLAQIPHPPAHKPHSTPSHGINLTPDEKEVWIVDGVYGYVYVYGVTQMPPKQTASIAIFRDPKEQPHSGWITFSTDGRYAYPDGGAVIDTSTKKVVAWIPTSEKLIEVDFENGQPSVAGHR